MNIAPDRKYLVNLESVAMTDIVMNMFIFFFISFSLLYTFNPTKAKHIKVNLPKARHVTAAKAASDTAQITLSSEGPLYLDGQLTTFKDLESMLGARHKENPSVSVLIQVDRMVPFRNVVRVLDILNGLDIDRLRIAAEEEDK